MGQQKVYGNNIVFCGGKFVAGPDARSCIVAILMILVPSIVWQLEVGVFFTERYSVLYPAVAAVAQVGSLVLLMATAFSDPGIVPRQKNFQEQYDHRTKTFRSKQPPRYYDLLLRLHPSRLKYCITCNIYRPPRCTHCSVCENCIERFDHHCPWIGNCIGRRNYWLFYLFVSVTGLLNVFVLATSISQVVVICQEIIAADMLGRGDALINAMGEAPLATALSVYCAGVVWFTVGLCGYHTYLICTNQTTYEQIKGAYTPGTNPFNRGIVGNIQDALCSKVRRRYFDASTGRLRWPSSKAASAQQHNDSAGPNETILSIPSVPAACSEQGTENAEANEQAMAQTPSALGT